MANIFSPVIWLLKNIVYSLLGLICITAMVILACIFSPIYLYRWLICKVVAPLCRRDTGKPLTVNSSMLGSEFIDKQSRIRTRCAIVVSLFCQGPWTPEGLREQIRKNWLHGRIDSGSGSGLVYPEFQQHIESWMGYLFWKQDKSFNLENHLGFHKCEESWTDGECEEFARSMVEELMSKPFPRKRSPWEIHVIEGYRNSEFLPGAVDKDKEMAILIFRCHHALADGVSIFYALCEQLYGMPLSECSITRRKPSDGRKKSNPIKELINSACFPLRAMRDIGYSTVITMFPIKTSWFIPENQQTGRTQFIRSGMVPTSKIKFVKNTFGVSFTSVLTSSLAAGIVNAFKGRGFPTRVKTLPLGLSVHMKDRSLKLRNNVAGLILEFPIDQALSPVQRLKESEKYYQQGRSSTLPLISALGLKLVASLPPRIAKTLLTNHAMSSGLTNFPGGGIPLTGHGIKVVTKDFGSGLLFGVQGAGFFIISYCDHIRISIVAEKAAMDRSEMEELLGTILAEIEKLYELAKEEKCAEIGFAEKIV